MSDLGGLTVLADTSTHAFSSSRTSPRAGRSSPLCDEGWTVDLAADSAQALTKLEEATFDLVVLDIMLPGVDGLQVLHRMRVAGTTRVLISRPATRWTASMRSIVAPTTTSPSPS